MPIVSVQKLENADKDADSLNKFVNGADSESVKTRLNAEYPTLANAVRQIMETGGFEPFATELDLLVSIPTIEKKAAKALDTKKIWYWDGAKWNDTGLSEKDSAIQHTNETIEKVTENLLVSTNKIVNEDGDKLALSVISEMLNKILFGITNNGGMQIGDLFLKELNNQWMLADGAGRSFLRYKDGQFYFLNYKITISGSGFMVLDQTGKAIFRVSKNGTIYATKYQNIPQPKNLTNYQISDTGQFKETDVTHELVYGQSLSVSTSSAIPIQSTTQEYNNLMFAGGVRLRVSDSDFNASDFSPLVESVKETPCSGICNGLSKRFTNTFSKLNAPEQKFLGTTTGDGGKSVLYLSPIEDGGNSAPSRYIETIESVRLAKKLCDSKGMSYSVGSYNWVQGENDSNTPLYQYSIRLRNLKQRLDQDILEITGQRYRPVMVMAQTAGHRRYARSYFGPCLSQLNISKNYDDMVLAVPIYQLPHSDDNLHLTGVGAWLMGQYIARASFNTRYLNDKWKPLQPSWVEWKATEIIIGGWNPKGTTLVLDDALCAMTDNFGFDLFKPDNTLIDIIAGVELMDSKTIKITLSQEAPIDARLSCGRGRDYMNNPNYGGPITGARTNIRDNHGDFDQVVNPLDGTIHKLHNASVMWQYDRQNGFNSI